MKSTQVDTVELGIFLTEVIGKLGDRHAYISKYELPNSLFLPFVAAPFGNEVIGLSYNDSLKQYRFLLENYPNLKSINGIKIQNFLKRICPAEVSAPNFSYHSRATKQLKYMEQNYAIMKQPLPKTFDFVFSNGTSDTLLQLPLESNRRKYYTWNDKFKIKYPHEKKELNDAALCKEWFNIDDNRIGVAKILDMARPNRAPIYYEKLNQFMKNANKSCDALILDVRSNDGGSRHLILELAKYLIHPDSVYVVNATRQRAVLPLDDDRIEDLNNRFLFPYNEFGERGQKAIDKFNSEFHPLYKLDDEKFSEFYYMIFNGKKISNSSSFFNKPVYILSNEKCFSAASILISSFKKLNNIKIVGLTTDGSSGNSKRFKLPHSKLSGKISTMVSFQKNGKILDGFGNRTRYFYWTKP